MRPSAPLSHIWRTCVTIVVSCILKVLSCPPPRCLNCVRGPACAHPHTSGFSLAIPRQGNAFLNGLGTSLQFASVRRTQLVWLSCGSLEAFGDAAQHLPALLANVVVASCVDLQGAASSPRTNSWERSLVFIMSEIFLPRHEVFCGTILRQARKRPHLPSDHSPVRQTKTNKRQIFVSSLFTR